MSCNQSNISSEFIRLVDSFWLATASVTCDIHGRNLKWVKGVLVFRFRCLPAWPVFWFALEEIFEAAGGHNGNGAWLNGAVHLGRLDRYQGQWHEASALWEHRRHGLRGGMFLVDGDWKGQIQNSNCRNSKHPGTCKYDPYYCFESCCSGHRFADLCKHRTLEGPSYHTRWCHLAAPWWPKGPSRDCDRQSLYEHRPSSHGTLVWRANFCMFLFVSFCFCFGGRQFSQIETGTWES